ncbi:uncharacterized protein LOC127873287 isoform X2 [Dreissena polymorpha]|nr:uncharacterized protein LOC127873287 isoform X2 [Dreissena polymorpha]XP_052273031.1 uncharacterized protein LOC127873287 isoform X2 [Dreissena polymorpha]
MASISFKIIALTALVAMVHGFHSEKNHPMPGGKFPIGSDDLSVEKVAQFAANDIGSEYTLDSVEDAQKAIVEGSIYYLKIKISKPQDGITIKRRTCDVKVYEPLNTENLELISFECSGADFLRMQLDHPFF